MKALLSLIILAGTSYGIYLETGPYTAISMYTMGTFLWFWVQVVESRDNQRHMMFMSAMDDLIKIQKTINRKMSSSLSPEQHDRLYNKPQDPS